MLCSRAYTIGSLTFLQMKNIALLRASITRRCASGFLAASLLFFLLYSAPHQVHHFFESATNKHHRGADHHDSNSGQDSRSSAGSDCVFQLSASRCHLGFAWHITPASLPVLVRSLTVFPAADNHRNFRPAAFHIRAPPLV